jgi:hypothetical protein
MWYDTGMLDLSAKPLDADLQAELDAARSGFTYEFTARAIAEKQRQRDKLAAMPRDTRRRALVRQSFEEVLPTAEDLRHIHSAGDLLSAVFAASA